MAFKCFTHSAKRPSRHEEWTSGFSQPCYEFLGFQHLPVWTVTETGTPCQICQVASEQDLWNPVY